MKKTLILCLTILASFSLNMQAQGNKKNLPLKLQNKTDSASYALGQNVTDGLKQYLVSVGVLQDTTNVQDKKKIEKINEANFKSFLKGLESALVDATPETNSYNTGIGIGNQLSSIGDRFEKDVLSGEKLNKPIFRQSVMAALNGQEALIPNSNEYIQQIAMEAQQAEELKKAEELKAQYQDEIAAGEKFLADNKTKEGVVTLPSGLQYKVIAQGTGAIPKKTDQVKVHYEGKLLDGTIFDSSYQRGEPATFGVTQVIQGWIEALQLMPEGSKWTIYIPYDLAYGSRDQGAIKPFSTLIFDIELIEIVK